MSPSACSRLSLSSGIEVCGIAIEDDHVVMDVLKLVLDGELGDKDILPKFLKMNKSKLVKCILILIPLSWFL
jgi:hypothetical protein